MRVRKLKRKEKFSYLVFYQFLPHFIILYVKISNPFGSALFPELTGISHSDSSAAF